MRFAQDRPMRVFVTGPTGCGKSTVAMKLARATGLPHFPLDEIHWLRHPSGDTRRELAERLSMLQTIVRRDAWIIEGVQFKWADLAMERADRIVVLDLPRWRNIVRILRRFSGRRLRSGVDHRGTLRALMDELSWSADYFGYEREMLFNTLVRWPDKLIVARSAREERSLFETLLAAV